MRRGFGQRIFLILIRKVSFIKYIDLVSSFIIKYTDLESHPGRPGVAIEIFYLTGRP